MKPARSLALGAVVAIAAFLAGRWTAPAASGSQPAAPLVGSDSSRPVGSPSAKAAP